MLKRSYDLVAALLQIQQILHSLRVKINVAQWVIIFASF